MAEDPADLERLRSLGDYQFGAGAGTVLFPRGSTPSIRRTRSGRPRQILAAEGRIASLTTLGRLTLGLVGGRRLHRARPGSYSATVSAESDPHVREGKNAFAKFITRVDPQIRPGDELCVVSEDGSLLGVGRAVLSAAGMDDFESGVAVSIRHGASEMEKDNGEPP